jgi:hypothetical protein
VSGEVRRAGRHLGLVVAQARRPGLRLGPQPHRWQVRRGRLRLRRRRERVGHATQLQRGERRGGLPRLRFRRGPVRLTDNVIRFNVSENDGRKNGYAGISVNGAGGPVERLHVYHNTVFVGPSDGEGRPQAVFIHRSKDCRFHNNLFITASGCALADVGGGQSGLRVQGNHYWAADGAFLVRQAGKQFSSLAGWREHGGVERLAGKDVGAADDPLLNAFGRGDIVTDAGGRAALGRYKPRKGSPLIGSALDLERLFKIKPGDTDFWGNRLPKDTPPAVGAHAG